MSWQEQYSQKCVDVAEAVKLVESGDIVCTPGGPCASYDLMDALAQRKDELENVKVSSALLMRPVPHFGADFKGHIGHIALFLGPLERIFMKGENIEVLSCSFSHFDSLITRRLKPNVLFMTCSPPDERGFMSYGPGGASVIHSIRKTAEKVIAQVNRKTPHVFGTHAMIHVRDVDVICEHDSDIPVLPDIPVNDDHKKIASHIIDLIPDGACIQLGLGEIANAVGFFLREKRDLGAHTEMLTDSMMDLCNEGVINCSRKQFFPGKITFGFGVGSSELYRFMDKNPMLESMPIHFVTDIRNIAMMDNFVSVNNALSVDLTGQVSSESIGFTMYSGTGGQLDFVRGARYSKNGMSFIALNSVSEKNGKLISRIKTALEPGTIVTTPRTDVQYIVTEYGIADLWLKQVNERTEAMISIAHPDFRDALYREATEAGLIAKSTVLVKN